MIKKLKTTEEAWSDQYIGSNIIRLRFNVPEKVMTDLEIKLNEAKLYRRQFFRNVIDDFLADDPDFMKYFMSMLQKKTKQTKAQEKFLEKEREVIKQQASDLKLDDSEISNLFDLIEKESDDL